MSNNLYKCYFKSDPSLSFVVVAKNDIEATQIFYDESLAYPACAGAVEDIELELIKKGVPRTTGVLDPDDFLYPTKELDAVDYLGW